MREVFQLNLTETWTFQMNSNQSVSATLKHLQAQPEILDDVQAGDRPCTELLKQLTDIRCWSRWQWDARIVPCTCVSRWWTLNLFPHLLPSKGLVASEESELEEAIRRSLCADYDVLASRVEERISQTPSPSGQDPNLDLEHRSLENSRDTEVGVETPSPDISGIFAGRIGACVPANPSPREKLLLSGGFHRFSFWMIDIITIFHDRSS